MADDKLSYNDLIQPDDSLASLVNLLETTNKQYTTLANNVIKAAEKIEAALKKQSGATNEGRKVIKDSTDQLSRYEKVLAELQYAISDTGAKEAWLKARITEVNKQTVDQERYTRQLEGSYERLATDLKNAVAAYKAMSPEMRNYSLQGDAVLAQISDLRTKLNSLDQLIKGHVESLTKLQKAEQDLAYAQSDEGKQTAITRNAIREQNKATVEAQKITQQRLGSIDQLKTKLNKAVTAFNALSKAERERARGQALITQIQAYNKEIATETAKLKEQAPIIDRVTQLKERLRYARIAEGRQEALLRAEIANTNKATVEAEKRNQALTGSYDQLQLELERAIREYKAFYTAMSAQDRSTAAQNILNLKAQLKAYKDEISLTTPGLTKLQKAEQDLAYLLEDEGRKYSSVVNKINKIRAARRELKDMTQRLTEAQAKLTIAESVENVQLKEKEINTRKANEQARWMAQLNASKAGSFNALQAQYQLNIIKLNSLSAAEREAAAGAGGLIQQTQDLYNMMRKMQDQTGGYIKNVGNYKKIWDGLGFSVTQVVRELPAAAVSANTFFLAISNNIPMIIDEVKKLRIENEAARRAGEKTKSVWGAVGKSLFSFNTALVLVLTAFSMWGKDIIAWISSIGKARGEIMSITKATVALHEQLKKGADDYAKNRTSLERLKVEWSKLTSDKEKLQFIKDNKTAFDQLDVSVTNVKEAENLLVTNTENFITAMKLRAKAAAATALAQEEYNKSLQAEAKMGYYTDIQGNQKELTKEDLAALPFMERLALTFSDFWNRDAQAKAQKRLANLKKDAEQAEGNAEQYIDLFEKYFSENEELLKSFGFDSAHKRGRQGRQPRDLTDTIMRNQIEIRKKYEESITNLIHEEYTKRRKELADSAADEIARLEEKRRKNIEYLENVNGKYKELTAEQRIIVLAQQQAIADAQTNIQRRLNYDLEQLERERKATAITILRETLDWSVDEMAKSIKQERALKLKQIDEEAKLELDTNKDRDEAEIMAYYAKKKIDITEEYNQQILELYQAENDARLDLVKKGSQEELEVLLRQNELARQLALSQNRAKPAAERVDESAINMQFNQQSLSIQGTFEMTGYDEAAAADKARFEATKHTQDQITEYTLNAEKARLQKQLDLVQKGMLKMSNAQVLAMVNTIDKIDAELDELKDPFAKIGKNGLGYTLLEALGLNDKQISAIEEATSIIINNLKEIAQAEVDAAQAAVEAAEERVSAAQSAYEAEVEARNNGYANNVATAKKELEQEKKNQAAKQKMLEAAQKRQERLDSIAQASSLITASANIWSSFSKMGPFGPALAIAAIAGMWTSFAAAKIKARQVTAQSEEYGEGGLEFLEGGSHASGNDIDLQTTNRKGKRMRAEGGEALAIINKKQTRRYRRALPDIIKSLNSGNFEEKYLNAFQAGEKATSIMVNNNSNTDLSRLEKEVKEIRRQNETKYYTLSDGRSVIINKNVKRIIKN